MKSLCKNQQEKQKNNKGRKIYPFWKDDTLEEIFNER